MSTNNQKVLVIDACFYEDINLLLRQGVIDALKAADLNYEIIKVNGALESGFATKFMLEKAKSSNFSYLACIAIGCIIRGDTYHFEVVAQESIRCLNNVCLKYNIPFGNSILTVENQEQAFVRADPNKYNKGGHAVNAALTLAKIKNS